MTSDNSLSLILRRLDEIERKLDHMLEELRTLNTPAAAAPGYAAALVGPGIFGEGEPGTGAKRPRSIRLNAMQQQSGKGRILLRSALPTCPGPSNGWGLFHRPARRATTGRALIDVIDVVG
jgi:hypothetical protein